MPHFGLMDEDALGPEAGPLLRARLHIRGGRRRLSQGKVAAGIVTLYDALTSALGWYISSPERQKGLEILAGEDVRDEETVYWVLVRSGRLDGKFDFAAFDGLVSKAVAQETQEMPGLDYRPMLRGFESVMAQLGVMPFDEGELPPEDPSTF